jgi:hypothetical protein
MAEKFTNRHDILVEVKLLGGNKTFIDGHYLDKDWAEEIRDHWADTYPYLKFKLAPAIKGHTITDDEFMARNRELLEYANRVEESKISPKWTRGPMTEVKLH